jgi:hypothetical protein
MQEHGAEERLVAEFADTFSRETVLECLKDTAKRWVDAPVQTFVELLSERFARESLRAAANA